MTIRLSRWGNSTGLRLPAAVMEAAGLKAGDYAYARLLDSAHGVYSPKRLHAGGSASPVIIQSNKWGEAFKPLSRLLQQAVQSNMVYLPREAFLVSISIAARRINANR